MLLPHPVRTPSSMYLRHCSPPRRKLVELMQSIYFGRMESLVVRRGEPVFSPPPTVIVEIKLASEELPHPPGEGDFHLKAEIIALFHSFDRLRDGNVMRLEIRHGLPFRLLLDGSSPV